MYHSSFLKKENKNSLLLKLIQVGGFMQMFI